MRHPFACDFHWLRGFTAGQAFYLSSFLAAGLLLSGCEKAEVSVYDAPKEDLGTVQATRINRVTPQVEGSTNDLPGDAVPTPSPMTAPATSQGGVAAPEVQNDLHWSPPADWQAQPPTQFRRGSYVVSGDEGDIDVSIIALAGDGGGLAANINRWRQQLNLEPWNESDFQENARMLEMNGTRAIYVSFSGTGSGQMTPAAAGEGAAMNRILAAILPNGNETWFFKMTGPEPMVETREDEFLNFLVTVHDAAGHEHHGQPDPAPAVAPAPTAPAAPGMAQMTGDVANAISGQGLTYTVPEGWQELESGPVRAASFSAGEEDDLMDVSVIALGGQSGSLLANLNRWRGQIGLAPVNSPDEAGTEPVTVSGIEGKFVTMENNGQSISVAMVDHNGATWFFKAAGSSTVVKANANQFREFLDSVSLP